MPTLEDAMMAEPHVNCSRPKCAGRHVCASITEWQFRQSNAGLEPLSKKEPDLQQ